MRRGPSKTTAEKAPIPSLLLELTQVFAIPKLEKKQTQPLLALSWVMSKMARARVQTNAKTSPPLGGWPWIPLQWKLNPPCRRCIEWNWAIGKATCERLFAHDFFLVPFWNHTWNQLHLLPRTMKSQSSLMPKQGSQNSSPTQIARPTQHCTGRDLSSSESRYAVKCWEQAIQKIWLPCHLLCGEKGAFCQLVVMNRLEVLAISSFKCHSRQDTHKRGLHIQHPPLLWGWRRRCCGRLSFVSSKQGYLVRADVESFCLEI